MKKLLESNAVTNIDYNRIETIEINPVPADIHEDLFWGKCFESIITNKSKRCS